MPDQQKSSGTAESELERIEDAMMRVAMGVQKGKFLPHDVHNEAVNLLAWHQKAVAETYARGYNTGWQKAHRRNNRLPKIAEQLRQMLASIEEPSAPTKETRDE